MTRCDRSECVFQAFQGVAERSSSEAQPRGSAQGGCHLTHLMQPQGSYNQRDRLQRSGAHTSVCIRSIAAHVNRSNSVRIRLQIRDRSAGGAQKHTNRSPPQPGHRLSGTRPQQRPELSTAARHVGSVTRRHRNSHTKQRRVRRTSFYTCLPNPYTPKKLPRGRRPSTLR